MDVFDAKTPEDELQVLFKVLYVEECALVSNLDCKLAADALYLHPFTIVALRVLALVPFI